MTVAALGAPTPLTSQVPLCVGTTIVTAVSQREGDYESIKTIDAVTDREISIRYSTELPNGGAGVRKIRIQRRVLLADMASAPLYMRTFAARAAITFPGTTAIGTSVAVLRSLKATGSAKLGLFDKTGSESPADPATHPNVYDYKDVETIRRVGSGRVMVPVVVNDAATTLPAIQARGDFLGDPAEFFFLDDEDNPLALRYRVGSDSLNVVKIAYRCLPKGAGVVRTSRIEQALLTTGKVDVYSIYFSFNSDQVREESDSTLREIADVLRRHPDWKLGINGYTDNIGGDTYNLELSRRRSAAVKAALTSRFAIVDGRIATAGYGKANPKDTNDTLEGRARNRRVELVRQ